MKLSILITGANGFIGKHLIKYLEKNYNIFTIISNSSKYIPSNIRNKNVIDLTDKDYTKDYFEEFKKKYNIDIIIHLASKLASPIEINNINILYQNIKITESVVEIAKILKPKKIINFSSIAVYPNTDGIYSESSEIKPSANTDCWYGLSKFCSENIFDFILRNENIVISNLRVAQVYGEGMREDRTIPMMLKEVKEKNTITIFGDGERVSNFMMLDELLNILEQFILKDLHGIYNIGCENLSYMDLAKKLINKYGNKESKIIKKSTGSRAKFYLNTTKINNIINEPT